MEIDAWIMIVLVCGGLLTIDGMFEEKKWLFGVGIVVFIIGVCLLFGYLMS